MRRHILLYDYLCWFYFFFFSELLHDVFTQFCRIFSYWWLRAVSVGNIRFLVFYFVNIFPSLFLNFFLSSLFSWAFNLYIVKYFLLNSRFLILYCNYLILDSGLITYLSYSPFASFISFLELTLFNLGIFKVKK